MYLLANNFIGYEFQYINPNLLLPSPDSLRSLTGIDVGGTVPLNAAILNNTIRLEHTAARNASYILYSTPIH